MAMTFGAGGFALLRQFESLRLTAYQDQKGVWTVGEGHTGRDVHEGMTITPEQARALLLLDLKVAMTAVNHCVRVALTQNQFDALVCFAFNVGCGAFATSTLLRDVNVNNIIDAEAQFLRWDHIGSAESPGLLARRRAEAALFAKAA